jgi:hypothetical protein
MVVEVVFGAVLVFLGFCALLGLPSIAIHLELRDERSHGSEKDVITAAPTVSAAKSDVTYH